LGGNHIPNPTATKDKIISTVAALYVWPVALTLKAERNSTKTSINGLAIRCFFFNKNDLKLDD